MKLTIYTANCSGNPKNSIYPNKVAVTCEDDMTAAVAYDHVCADYKNKHRSVSNFIESDVDVLDCDNDHSDNPNDWIYPEDYEKYFPGVRYVIVPSRNNMKVKGGKSERPRHHVYFPHTTYHSAEKSEELK